MKSHRRGLFIPALFCGVMIAGMLYTALLTQFTATAHHVQRIDSREQARLLADSIARLKTLPPGATGFELEGHAVRVLVHSDGRRDVDVR